MAHYRRGTHGTYLSNLLTRQEGLTCDDVRVLDPHDEPLALWTRNTGNCGMQYLRSPSAHNLDVNVLSIYHYAKTEDGRRRRHQLTHSRILPL